MCYVLRANRMDLLSLVAKRKVITRDDFIHAFDYSYHGAYSAIRRLSKAGLIESEISPDGRSKNWSPLRVRWKLKALK